MRKQRKKEETRLTCPETVKLFTLVTLLYPRDTSFKGASVEMTKAWQVMLSDITYEQAVTALQLHAASSVFAPSIADIRRNAARPLLQDTTADEAWGSALKAIHRYGYNCPDQAKNSVQPEVWAVMESMGYKALCMSDNTDVIRGQFTRAWEARQRRRAETAMLPPALRQAIKQIDGGEIWKNR
jgi:hypothetical protein